MLNPISVARQILQTAGLILGLRWGIEEPRYTVQARANGVEIRRYCARVAAETVVQADDEAARNIGFRRLAGYIFGANRGATKIDMTAPVAQQSAKAATGVEIEMTAPVAQVRSQAGESVIRFFMPASWTIESLPEPIDEQVRLVEVPPETVAVLQFTGDRGVDTVDRRTEALLQALAETHYETVGMPVTWLYDPPFTLPFRRRSEVAVPVIVRASAS